jgi:hypothetical protein
VGDVVILGVDTIAERANAALRSEYDRAEATEALRKHCYGVIDGILELAPNYLKLEAPFLEAYKSSNDVLAHLKKLAPAVDARIDFLEGATSMLSHLVNST